MHPRFRRLLSGPRAWFITQGTGPGIARDSLPTGAGGGGLSRSAPREHLLSAPDGRHIAAAEFGQPAGFPVFYFHGWPGSRLEPGYLASAAEAVGVRLLGLDRAGYGRSSYVAGNRFAQAAADVLTAADALGLERFAVLGMSGGGPFSLACAAHLGGRVAAAGIMAGLGPLHLPVAAAGMSRVRRVSCALLRRQPSLSAPLAYASLTWLRRRTEASLRSSVAGLPPEDRAVMAEPERFAGLVGSFREGLRPGLRGAARDLRLYFEGWDFHPAEIRVPVLFHHGLADTIVPAAASRQLAQTIPGAALELVPGEGHYSLPLLHGQRILEHLLRAARA